MLRPQFRLSTLLWITLAVACFFGGRVVERQITWRDYWRRERDLKAREDVVMSRWDIINHEEQYLRRSSPSP
jgi:hypothetical protein